MEIRNNNTPNAGPSKIDLTKVNRDSIHERIPSPPVQPPQTPTGDSELPGSKRIKRAREEFAAAQSVHKRIEAARKRHAAGQPDQLSVSSGAQVLADTAIRAGSTQSDAATRATQVSELKAMYSAGTLDVSSLVAESAYRMLSGE